jgi:hypothetical protein
LSNSRAQCLNALAVKTNPMRPKTRTHESAFDLL